MNLKTKALKFLTSERKVLLLMGGMHEVKVMLFKRLRLSSYPFISGDTFRALSDVKIDQISEKSLFTAKKTIEDLFK